MKRLLLLSSACLVLTACLDDGTLAERIEKTESARVVYSASALKNFAMMTATGQGPLGEVREGPNGLRSMTCAAYDGKREGYSLSWVDAGIDNPAYVGRNSKAAARSGAEGLPQGSIAANISRELGPQFVAAWSGGKLVRSGEVMPFSSLDCPLPELPDGSPVVMVPVKIPDGSFTASTREEKRADACPEGEVGAAIYTRQVQFTKDGKRIEGQWHLDSLAGCREAHTVEAVVVDVQKAPPSVSATAGTEDTEKTALMKQVDAAVSGNCKEVTLTHRTGQKERSARKFSTCDFVEVAAIAQPEEPVGVPKQPKEPPPQPPPCPATPVNLPTYSTVADYLRAVEPYKEVLRNWPAYCPALVLQSVAHWPFYQPFRLVNPPAWGCAVEGVIYSGMVIDATTAWGKWLVYLGYRKTCMTEGWVNSKGVRYVVRKYPVALRLTWTGAAGDTEFTQRHALPFQGWYSNARQYSTDIRNFPEAFKSDGGYNVIEVRFSLSGVVLYGQNYRQNGITHPDFVGPRSVASYDKNGGLNGTFPIIYGNDKTDPWGNTETQLNYMPADGFYSFTNADERGSGIVTFDE